MGIKNGFMEVAIFSLKGFRWTTTLKVKGKGVTKQWKPKSTRKVEDLQIRAACCKYPFGSTQFSLSDFFAHTKDPSYL